jgi:hypothetical protein
MNVSLTEKFTVEQPQLLQVFLQTSTGLLQVTEVNAYPAHAMNVYGGVNVKLQSFLPSVRHTEVSGQLLTPWMCMAEWMSNSSNSYSQYDTWRWLVSFSRNEGVWRSGCQTPVILTLSMTHEGDWSASHAMKVYGVVDVKLHSFWTSVRHGGEWSATSVDHFTSSIYWAPHPEYILWGTTNFCPSQGSNHHASVVHPVTLSLSQDLQLQWFIYFPDYDSRSHTLSVVVTYLCSCLNKHCKLCDL